MSQTTQTLPEFGKWRSRLWPVYSFELKKLLPMFFMMFFISFNYTILRDTKDGLVVTAAGSGAEAIPFLKVWGVLPFAVIFMLIYAKLANKLSKERLFYVTVVPFLIFFALFALYIYPMREVLHPNEFADKLQSFLPEGFKGGIALIRNWTFSLFYIMSELWGSVALSLLFWGFANDIMKVTEAKRFYSVLGIGANLALCVSGPTISYFSRLRENLPAGVDPWGYSLNYLMGMVVVAGLIIMAIYRWINRKVLTDVRFYNPAEQKKAKKSKPKMSLKESMMYLVRSKYMGCLAILVIAYGIAINIIEVTWKAQLKLQYPTPNQYTEFMGYFSLTTGIVAVLMMLFVGGNVIRRFGWGIAAKITPIVLFITGTAFLSFVLFKNSIAGSFAMVAASPLMWIVIFGAVQNITSKSCKYSLFDPTKEMAYIPLDQESKVKGKAAIDVVGARFGKSGGSLLQQGLLVVLGSVAAMTPYVVVILCVIFFAWMIAVKSLNKQFTKLSSEKEEESAKEEAAATTAEEPAIAAKASAQEQEVTS